jgi:ankyrin repeat protein
MPPKRLQESQKKITNSSNQLLNSASPQSTEVFQPHISTYYQNQFFSNPSDLQIVEKIKEEFFGEAKFSNCSKAEIIDFLRVVKFTSSEKFSEEHLSKLLTKINQILLLNKEPSSVEEISLILEAFAGSGYEKYQLQKLEIRNLVNIFEQQKKLSSNDISRFIKACAKFSYDKDELEINIPKLIGEINLQFGNFNVGEKTTLLNLLVKLGYDANHNEFNSTLVKISQSIRKEIASCNEAQIASLIHSLVKMEMFDELFVEKDGQQILQQQIANFFTPEKIANLSSDSAFSLLQAYMYCDLLRNVKLCEEAIINTIADKYPPKENKTSNLQRKVAKALIEIGCQVEEEYPVYKIKDKAVRCVDMKLKIKKDSSSFEYFIEVEGPSHFFTKYQSELISDSATRKRDRLNEAAIKRNDTISICKYAKLPFTEIEQIEKNKGDLADYILEKIEAAKVTETDIYQNSLKTTSQIEAKEQVVISKTNNENLKSEKILPPSASGPKNINSPSKISQKIAAENTKTNSSSKQKKANPLSPFEQAILDANIANLESEIKAGIDVNEILSNGLDAFSFAVEATYDNEFESYVYDLQKLVVLNTLVVAGADVSNYKPIKKLATAATNSKKSRKNNSSQSQQNPLQELVERVVTKEYESLFCALVKLESVSLGHKTINSALKSGSVKIVEAVVSKKGFDPNATEVIEATKSVVKKIIEETCDIKILSVLLLQANVNPELIKFQESDPDQKLLDKSIVGCPEIFSIVLDQQKIIKKSFNLIVLASDTANVTAVEELLLRNKFSDYEKLVAMRYACQKGCKELIELLIKNGASINNDSDYNYGGEPPLIIAVRLDNPDAVSTLIKNNVKIDEVSPLDGCSALIVAARKGNINIVKLLLENKAKVNTQSSKGNSALMLAVNNGHIDVVEALLESGANVALVNIVGGTALDVVQQKFEDLAPNSNEIKLLFERCSSTKNAAVNLSSDTKPVKSPHGKSANQFNKPKNHSID